MTIAEKETDIINEFAIFEDWMEKYEYIIDLGKDLPIIKEQLKTEDKIIKGCQSQVWVNSELEGGKMRFTADSDAIITKGIIALLIRVLDNETPTDVAKAELNFIKAIGLQEHLSPTRANGLVSMVKKMKMDALKLVN
ncbi:MAG: SufE family protein [Lishizhenia sp.]